MKKNEILIVMKMDGAFSFKLLQEMPLEQII